MASNVHFIAHRGYSAILPENTTSSFQAALDFRDGTDMVAGIELDIRLSGDQRIVVFHDSDLKRMCGSKLLVHKAPYAQLAEASSRAERMEHQKIPLLSEVLRQVDHRKAIYCEIKAGDYDFDVMVRRLAALLEEYSPRDDMVLHSFSVELMNRMIPATGHLDVKHGLLFDRLKQLRGRGDELMKKLDYLHPQFELLLRAPDEVLTRGKKVNTWTVNRVEDLRRILSLNDRGQIAGIITDDLTLCDP